MGAARKELSPNENTWRALGERNPGKLLEKKSGGGEGGYNPVVRKTRVP